MAKARKTARKSARRATRTARRATPSDAITLLKNDHRQVEEWFEQFESSRSGPRRQELAQKICQALKVHTQIEAEIFYPAFLEATQETEIHHEAEVEHEGAKKLIAEIESSDGEDEYFHAKVTVLSEMIKHHVNEEEQRDGMFAKARQADMDLESLGEQLATRKSELMASMGSETRAGRRKGDAAAAQLGR